MPTRIKASDLDRRITIQTITSGKDAEGFPTPEEWTDFITVWAKREPLRGREFFQAAAVNAENTVRYKIRYRDGITSEMRLVDARDERIYTISAVLDDVFDDRTETHLMTTEVPANG